ncbi:MAG: hypothetical protein HYV09_11490 [Deltaproteobacteria bacterium]|nr:hypothetical protein [Deltaproteobacteria bacterium]
MASALQRDLETIELPIPMIREQLLPAMRAMANGEPLGKDVRYFRLFVDSTTQSPRQRAFFLQISAEFFCAAEHWDKARDALTAAAEMPLIDVLWMDRCPAIAELRDDAAFARARAIVAARAADVFA